jgi:Cyclin, N-terminal domain
MLLFAMEIFKRVLTRSKKCGTTFNIQNNSVFKIFIVCFSLSAKFLDDMNFISIEDLAYLDDSDSKLIKILEYSILNDVLNWKVINLKRVDS